MKNLEINLKNCYGIDALVHSFVFKNDKHTQIVYAKNGMMKSSFTKVFDDISNGIMPQELVYGRVASCDIKVDGDAIEPECICAIKSEPSYIPPQKMSTLLVNEKLKSSYENEISNIETEVSKLITFIKGKTGKRKEKDVLEEFTKAFGKSYNNYLELLEDLKSTVKGEKRGFDSIEYSVVFDDKVKDFLEKKDFKEKLAEYVKIYDKLISQSKYFKKGVFNYNNAEDICKSLKSNNFFDAEHSVILKGEHANITSSKDLEKEIDNDKNKIFTDTELKKKFDDIDKAITKNAQLSTFRSYIEKYPEIISQLQDINEFKKNVWISYLQDSAVLYENFLEAYIKAKNNIETIIRQAKEEKTDWENVTKIFNNRFEVPFILELANQEDVILKSETSPQIKFIYKDSCGNKKEIEKETLIGEVLSTGEKRALYILNILFEIEVRKKVGKDQLLIIDDIADSFDYENKYAIIEYLQDIAEAQNNIFMIILTHNFDFFRTLQFRFFGKKLRDQSNMALRNSSGGLELTKAAYFNPFAYFRSNWNSNPKIFIAMVPFARNLVEYLSGESEQNYYDLTCVLHIKNKTANITVKDVKDIFNNIFSLNNQFTGTGFNETKNIVDFIYEEADKISHNGGSAGINLENNVVLSIAIRLLAENIMLDEITKKDATYPSSLGDAYNQTREIYKKYLQEFSNEEKKIELMKQVMLMTPENIHLNSFMYEPILDIGESHMRRLYFDLKVFKPRNV